MGSGTITFIGPAPDGDGGKIEVPSLPAGRQLAVKPAATLASEPSPSKETPAPEWAVPKVHWDGKEIHLPLIVQGGQRFVRMDLHNNAQLEREAALGADRGTPGGGAGGPPRKPPAHPGEPAAPLPASFVLAAGDPRLGPFSAAFTPSFNGPRAWPESTWHIYSSPQAPAPEGAVPPAPAPQAEAQPAEEPYLGEFSFHKEDIPGPLWGSDSVQPAEALPPLQWPQHYSLEDALLLHGEWSGSEATPQPPGSIPSFPLSDVHFHTLSPAHGAIQNLMLADEPPGRGGTVLPGAGEFDRYGEIELEIWSWMLKTELTVTEAASAGGQKIYRIYPPVHDPLRLDESETAIGHTRLIRRGEEIIDARYTPDISSPRTSRPQRLSELNLQLVYAHTHRQSGAAGEGAGIVRPFYGPRSPAEEALRKLTLIGERPGPRGHVLTDSEGRPVGEFDVYGEAWLNVFSSTIKVEITVTEEIANGQKVIRLYPPVRVPGNRAERVIGQTRLTRSATGESIAHFTPDVTPRPPR
jgi:hypothetical protein